MLTIVSGALAGIVHVLSGPDHLAAVLPLASARDQRSWVTGSLWGLGHTSGVVAIAVLAVLLRDLLPPIDLISAWSERLVGASLVAVGLWALRGGLRIDAAPHAHAGLEHEHLQVRRGPAMLKRLGHAHVAFLMGILHGVAGSAHFLGVLPALALPSRVASLAYLAAFGAASIVSMAAFAAAVGFAGARTRRSGAPAHRVLMLSGAMLAMLVGGIWLIGGAGGP